MHLRLDITHRGGTPVGHVGLEGSEPMAFTGWIALNAAIDRLLTDAAPEPEPDPPIQPRLA